jgi:hypothetical protein
MTAFNQPEYFLPSLFLIAYEGGLQSAESATVND